MSAFVDDAIVIGDNEDTEVRIVIESGYRDDRDRDALRFTIDLASGRAQIRLNTTDAKVLAKRIIDLAVGHPTKLTIRKARGLR
jgi:hypothetical protein